MDVSKAVAEANQFAEMLRGVRLPNDLRTRVAAACFAIAQQHHNSILILLARPEPLEATGMALLRPLLEAVIRGLWIARVATNEQVERFVTKGSDVSMSKMTKEIDAVTGMNSHSALYKGGWSFLSSYTHTGEFQVQRWLKTQHVKSSYSEQELAELLKFASLAGTLASQAVIDLSIKPSDAF